MERVEIEQWKGREVARLLALVETERRYYQEIVASIPVGLLVLSFDLAIVSSNRAIRKIFGLRSGDPVRGRLETLLPASVIDKIKGVFAEGGEPISNLLVDHEGRRLRIAVLPIKNGDDEGHYEALVTIEDLTGVSTVAPLPAAPQSLVTEAAAPASQQAPADSEAVELLQSLDAVIWAVDLPSMNFLFVTNTAEEVLGYNPDHWLNTPNFWSERIDPMDREAIVKSYQDAIEHGRRHNCEFRAQTADGRIVWLRETARILSGEEGQPKHLIGLTVDITERRQLEDEHVRAERMDAIGKLSARLSHDLNNMLMIVTGYGEELLHNIAKNDPVRSDVKEILSATERIGALTNDLLAFTRRQATPADTLDLSEMIGALEGTLRKTAGAGISIDIQNDPGLQAKANRTQLEQFLISLATRAGASLRDGGKLAITLGETHIDEDLRRAEEVLGPGKYAVISLEDNGGVLSHQAQMALFESFLPTRELPGETSAIISRGYTFVRQWGGDIAVSSTPAGTRISIFLPYAGHKEVVAAPQPEPPAAKPVEEPAPAPEAAPVLETILVVEDEAGIRALVRKILRRQGFTVLEASNGEEAVKTCQEHTGKIDLLITDVVMPKMGGRELVDSLKEHCQSMKVLYVSGYTDDSGIYAGDFAPGTAFLQKPFTLGSLLDKVKEVLGK